MQVILLERIGRLGQMGDVVNVKNGYARNFLLPQKKALRATKENMAAPEFAKAAKFFARFRDLTAGGFYTTPIGMKDIGYTGNVVLDRFDGPPLEALKKAGLA